ncbi:MAG: putative metal-binding motif-containing protein, partial [Nannocystaceae bacterium]
MGRLRFLLASLVLALGSCSPEVPSSTAFADDGPDTLTTANGDVGAPATTDDSSGGDEGTTTGTEPGEGLPGEACTSDADCVDYCDVPDGDSEGVCVEPCFGGTCPEGFVCAEIETGDGPVDVCVEAQDTFCQTCELNADCGDQTDLCVPLAGANYCTISCARDPEVCPPGFTCGLIGSADDGVVLQQCVPNNGVCCVDGDGDVFGEGEGCLGPDCDDENPDVNSSSPEICDGLDNDCDDLVDNDPVDCLAAGCELGTVGYFDYGAEACSDEGCVQSETNLCGLYTCEGGGSLGDVCATACNGEEDTLCVPDAHCDASVCEADYGYGVACDEVSDCASDHCQNGFCCAGGDCCQVDADCPLNPSDVSVCTQPVACQGSRGVTLCGGDFVCSSGGSVDDDSACDAAVEASDCGPYPSVFCNGAVDQQVPTCADSCADDADCDADAYCDTSTNECKADGDDGAPCG